MGANWTCELARYARQSAYLPVYFDGLRVFGVSEERGAKCCAKQCAYLLQPGVLQVAGMGGGFLFYDPQKLCVRIEL